MDRTCVRAPVTALRPHAQLPSDEDIALWGRVLNHLKNEAPLPAVLIRPWRWLNQSHRAFEPARPSATILAFKAPASPINQEPRNDQPA